MTTSQLGLLLLLIAGIVSMVCAAFGAYAGGERAGRRRLGVSLRAAAATQELLHEEIRAAVSAAREEVPQDWRERHAARADVDERIRRLEAQVADVLTAGRGTKAQFGNRPPRLSTPAIADGEDGPRASWEGVQMIESPRRSELGTAETLTIVQVGLDFADADSSSMTAGTAGGDQLVAAVRWTASVRSSDIAKPVADFLCRYAADKLVEAGWPVVTKAWVVTDHGQLDRAATGVVDFQNLICELVLGRPIDETGKVLGLHEARPAGVGNLAPALPLPGAESLGSVDTQVLVTGAIVGVATGDPALSAACIRSLAHNSATKLVTKAIQHLANRPSAQGSPRSEAEPTTVGAPGSQPGDSSRPSGPQQAQIRRGSTDPSGASAPRPPGANPWPDGDSFQQHAPPGIRDTGPRTPSSDS